MKNKKGDVLLLEAFHENVFKQIQKTRLPFFHINENKQVGHTFGEKLCHALESVYQLGFTKVLLVGNDCPSLTAKKIEKAAIALQSHTMVLGPNFNGGFYLMGIDQKAYNRNTFLALPWQTKALFTCFFTTTEATPHVLERLSDVNTKDDITTLWATSLLFQYIKAILTAFTTTLYSCSVYYMNFKNKVAHLYSFNKGSPVAFITL